MGRYLECTKTGNQFESKWFDDEIVMQVLLSIFLGSVEASGGKVLYESHPLGNLDLLLLRQLTRGPRDVRRGVVDGGSTLLEKKKKRKEG